MTERGTPASASALFERLWDELVSLLGTAATATLVRRSLKRAGPRIPELGGLHVDREGLDYRYVLPASWREPGRDAGAIALRRLYAEELDPLLRELTGTVVRRRLARVPELAALVQPAEEETR